MFSEGKSTAKTYDCKYIEVSAAIDHQIDDLFVGVLHQVRLVSLQRRQQQVLNRGAICSPMRTTRRWMPLDRSDSLDHRQNSDTCCLLAAREKVLAKLFTGQRRASKSCINLFEIWVMWDLYDTIPSPEEDEYELHEQGHWGDTIRLFGEVAYHEFRKQEQLGLYHSFLWGTWAFMSIEQEQRGLYHLFTWRTWIWVEWAAIVYAVYSPEKSEYSVLSKDCAVINMILYSFV